MKTLAELKAEKLEVNKAIKRFKDNEAYAKKVGREVGEPGRPANNLDASSRNESWVTRRKFPAGRLLSE